MRVWMSLCVWQQHSKLFYMLLRVRTVFLRFSFSLSVLATVPIVQLAPLCVCVQCVHVPCVVCRTLPGQKK